MFRREPEGRYRHRLCTAITPFWSSMEHRCNALLALNWRCIEYVDQLVTKYSSNKGIFLPVNFSFINYPFKIQYVFIVSIITDAFVMYSNPRKFHSPTCTSFNWFWGWNSLCIGCNFARSDKPWTSFAVIKSTSLYKVSMKLEYITKINYRT